LKAVPETAHVGLALPRFLLRLPYGAKTSSIDSFPYEEMPPDPLHGNYLWGSPVFACLALLAREGGGLDLESMPAHSYQKDGEWQIKPCAEILLTETQILGLIDMGLMPLVSYRDSDRIKLAGFRAINGGDLPFPSWSE
jgi:type VI secretion system protein ImpC